MQGETQFERYNVFDLHITGLTYIILIEFKNAVYKCSCK